MRPVVLALTVIIMLSVVACGDDQTGAPAPAPTDTPLSAPGAGLRSTVLRDPRAHSAHTLDGPIPTVGPKTPCNPPRTLISPRRQAGPRNQGCPSMQNRIQGPPRAARSRDVTVLGRFVTAGPRSLSPPLPGWQLPVGRR